MMDTKVKSKSISNLRAPLLVQFEVTHACNNDCVFCHNDLNRIETTSLNAAKKIIDELAEGGVFQVVLTGGEPLLHPDLIEILAYAKSKQLDVGIITNGILLEEMANSLVKYNLNSIQVSLLGHDSETHDSLVRNTGAFIKAIKGIEKLRSLGYKKININATLTKNNINNLKMIINKAKEVGAASFSVTRYIPVNKNDEAMMPTIEQINIAIKQLLESSGEIHTRWVNALPYCCISEDIEKKDAVKLLSGCDGGLTWGTITPVGDLVPCPCWQHDCGNIFDNSISYLWRNSQFLKNLRNEEYYPIKCKSCEYYKMCRGGCRGCATSWNDDVAGVDPYFINNANL